MRIGVSEWFVWMAKRACSSMYLPPLVLFNLLMGNERRRNSYLSIFLSSHLFLSLFLLHIERPWESGGAILGSNPHPTMLLNAHHNHAITLKHSSSPSLSTFVINPSSLIISIIIANPIPIFITIIANPNPKTYNTILAHQSEMDKRQRQTTIKIATKIDQKVINDDWDVNRNQK